MPADKDEKTEAPTPRKRREARSKGQVPRSQDITAATLLLSGFLALGFLGPALWHTLIEITQEALTSDAPMRLNEAMPFAAKVCVEVFKRIAPILIIMFFAILVVLYAQVGWLFTLQPLMPSLSKINPLSGLKRLFSVRSIMLAVINFGKLLVVGFVAYLALSGSAAAILYASTFEFQDVFRLGSGLLYSMAIKLSAALMLLALLDVAWQKYKHEQDLKMTKEEVKDELRSMEGDPTVKRRRRQVQLQLAMQRLGTDVPKADVIVTNPTHFAVAIAYDGDTMFAPKVVAKGADEIALRIRQIAMSVGIPIVERKALARGLYDAVDVGQYVPERFYRAIAEILAYVYELAGKSVTQRARNRKRQPVGIA